ncbi:MAG: DJ-1/PfpI family protein [Calditrichaeota bacterium]|nr:DJ-1/PfpI family protein [Calditrichota bacterium]
MKTALIILAPDFEEIEAVTIIDLLRRAEINVTTASIAELYVTGSHQITIKADSLLADVKNSLFDIIILPGGPGTKNLKASKDVIELIKTRDQKAEYIAAICAAPTVLEHAAILNGKSVTSFPAEKKVFINSNYVEQKVVKDGHIITSRGAGTAIDFSLSVIETLIDKKTAQALAERIVYNTTTI